MLNRILVVNGQETAGAGVKFAIPEKRCRILSIATTLTTSATVATRLVFLTFNVSGMNVIRVDANNTQSASSARSYTFAVNGDRATNPNLTHHASALPDVQLNPVAKVELFVESVDATDAFSNSVCMVELLE